MRQRIEVEICVKSVTLHNYRGKIMIAMIPFSSQVLVKPWIVKIASRAFLQSIKYESATRMVNLRFQSCPSCKPPQEE